MGKGSVYEEIRFRDTENWMSLCWNPSFAYDVTRKRWQSQEAVHKWTHWSTNVSS
jgi:hypothetical protein